MTMRNEVHVDEGRCSGHARCIGVAPDAFDYDEELERSSPSPGAGDVPLALLEAAALACPERAITVVRHEISAH